MKDAGEEKTGVLRPDGDEVQGRGDTAPKPAAGSRRTPLFVGSEIYRGSSYGSWHPLRIPRVSTVIDLARAMGWLPDAVYVDSPMASPEDLARFHEPAYVAAVQAAERTQKVDEATKQRFNLGVNGNPVFAEMYRRPATACGGSLKAAELVVDGGLVYSPAGGTHHGRPGQASGFCYFNDPVLCLLRLGELGLTPIAYVDFDAHHGDGVEAAFSQDKSVLTISVHESGRWPHTGDDSFGTGHGIRNIPVPRGFNDSEMAYVVENAVLPLVDALRPAAIVVQGGADALADDPLARLELSNNALCRAVASVVSLAPRAVVLGGGGYNPWSVGRCWTRLWGALNGREAPSVLSPEAEEVLRGLSWNHARGRNPPEHWFTSLVDRPNNGPIREEVRQAVRNVTGKSR